MSAYGSTARMAEAIQAGAEEQSGVRVSLYDPEGGETEPFVDLIEEADAFAFGSATINGDAVKPVWDLLSSLAVVNLKGKLGAAFGSYGWTGEAVRMIEYRMRGLKMRVPVAGLRIKLIPTEEELSECRAFGRRLTTALLGGNRGASLTSRSSAERHRGSTGSAANGPSLARAPERRVAARLARRPRPT